MKLFLRLSMPPIIILGMWLSYIYWIPVWITNYQIWQNEDKTHIVLDNMRLQQFPQQLLSHSTWKQVSLHGNDIKEIPHDIALFSQLQLLDMSVNELTEIPSSIGQLKELKVLRLQGNKIKKLPPEIQNLSNLLILDLSINNLHTLPLEINNLTNLHTLKLFGNCDLVLDETIFLSMESLTLLDVSDTSVTLDFVERLRESDLNLEIRWTSSGRCN